MLTIVIMVMFTFDNMKDALRKNFTEALKLFMPVFVLLGFSYLSS